MAWLAWIPAICAVASLACVIAGAIVALRAKNRLAAHVTATSTSARGAIDVKRLEDITARLVGADIVLDALVDRAYAAAVRIKTSCEELRLPQAMLALRTANAAIRLLVSGR